MKCIKVNLYPCCSANPAQIIFEEDPNNDPFPPKQAPKESAHIRGGNGRFNSSLLARSVAILIIIVVIGKLSTNADAMAETHKIRTIAVANRDSGPTEVIMACV